jgi:hypothetical protein
MFRVRRDVHADRGVQAIAGKILRSRVFAHDHFHIEVFLRESTLKKRERPGSPGLSGALIVEAGN